MIAATLSFTTTIAEASDGSNPENLELAIAMHFAETATERSTAELLSALPLLKGAMPRSRRQCDLVSAEIARRQQAQARHLRPRGTKHLPHSGQKACQRFFPLSAVLM